jgi:hypothetical protein
VNRVEHRFVDQVPDDIEHGVLYVSLPFRTTVHLCACGCGNQTWVLLRPDRHHLLYDGETVTLKGSIGNWEFPCQSHYWIEDSRILWDHENIDEPIPWWRRFSNWVRLRVHRRS